MKRAVVNINKVKAGISLKSNELERVLTEIMEENRDKFKILSADKGEFDPGPDIIWEDEKGNLCMAEVMGYGDNRFQYNPRFESAIYKTLKRVFATYDNKRVRKVALVLPDLITKGGRSLANRVRVEEFGGRNKGVVCETPSLWKALEKLAENEGVKLVLWIVQLEELKGTSGEVAIEAIYEHPFSDASEINEDKYKKGRKVL